MNLIKALIFLISISWTSIGFACRGGESEPKDSLEEAVAAAKIVLLAEAVEVEGDSEEKPFSAPNKAPLSTANRGITKANFKVLKSWKGSPGKSISFALETGRSCDIGKYLLKGTRWFFIADKDGDTISTRSHSQRLFEPAEEIKITNKISQILALKAK
jgi:hypothetical protein